MNKHYVELQSQPQQQQQSQPQPQQQQQQQQPHYVVCVQVSSRWVFGAPSQAGSKQENTLGDADKAQGSER